MKKVLVVDDSPSVRQQVSVALTQAGFAVVEAIDGQDGVTKAQAERPSAIVCDVNMPRMNGLEMLETLQRGGAMPPVLMLTSEAQPALVTRAKQAGAKGWIVKPFKANLLVAAIQKLVG